MKLPLTRCTVRSWRQEDAPSIARHADNREVWLNLRDAFPHPYGLEAGYACEARMRRSAIKDGKVIDQLLYAYVPEP